MEITLNNREIVGLFLLLSEHEEALDINMQKLENKLEKFIYDKISIQQLEKLGSLYRQGIDVLK